jgi:hypothetical protein
MSSVFFTHIRKTAGTSIKKSVLKPYLADLDGGAKVARPTGYRAALTTRGAFDLIQGHFPYGIHKLYFSNQPRYFVMLRDPIDRAISLYYFIISCSSSSYTHPQLNDAKQNSLTEFYEIPRYQNVQTRFVAGMGWEYAGRYLSFENWLGKRALCRAKNNLRHRYEAFGLQSRFRDTVRLFASRLAVEAQLPNKRHKKTSDRPSSSDLPESTISHLREKNSLDMALYRYAKNQFDSQFEGLPGPPPRDASITR